MSLTFSHFSLLFICVAEIFSQIRDEIRFRPEVETYAGPDCFES